MIEYKCPYCKTKVRSYEDWTLIPAIHLKLCDWCGRYIKIKIRIYNVNEKNANLKLISKLRNKRK